MGTSQSSSGSPSNIPIIPPWALGPEGTIEQPPKDSTGEGQSDAQNPNAPEQNPIAPAGRFGPSRRSLGNYVSSGKVDDMKRGLGHYIHKGLGGSGTAVRRFHATSVTAGKLYGTLSALANGQPTPTVSPLDAKLLRGKSAREVIDAIVEALRPTDGTQDTEACKDALKRAMAALLGVNPDADMLNLSEEERLIVVEQYVGYDIFNRVDLDVGKAIQDKAPSSTDAFKRLREIREYIKQTVAKAFRKLKSTESPLNSKTLQDLVRNVLKETFFVFEEFIL